MIVALALALAGLLALPGLPPAYVLPGTRVPMALAQQRVKQRAVRVEAELTGAGDEWPSEVVFELHPEHGYRVSDDQGGRWLIRDGAVLGATQRPVPVWIPDLEILVLNQEEAIQAWFVRAGIDLGTNELVRLEQRDCFLLGGQGARAQVWIDKDQMEILRWRSRGGRSTEYRSYSGWDGGRFPAVIELADRERPFATLAVHAVTRVKLRERDFKASWASAQGG